MKVFKPIRRGAFRIARKGNYALFGVAGVSWEVLVFQRRDSNGRCFPLAFGIFYPTPRQDNDWFARLRAAIGR